MAIYVRTSAREERSTSGFHRRRFGQKSSDRVAVGSGTTAIRARELKERRHPAVDGDARCGVVRRCVSGLLGVS